MSCKTPALLSYYSDKVNIYQHHDFIPLSAIKSIPPPLPAPIINVTNSYGVPYPVPTHFPPFPSCASCVAQNTCCESCQHKK